MRLPLRLLLCLLTCSLLVPAGCRRRSVLGDERTVSLKPGAIQGFPVDAPAKDQLVTVTISSPGAPVSVYLVMEKDREKVEDTLGVGRPPAATNVIISKEKAEEATLEATVAAKNAFAVVLHNTGDKPAQVKMTIKGR